VGFTLPFQPRYHRPGPQQRPEPESQTDQPSDDNCFLKANEVATDAKKEGAKGLAAALNDAVHARSPTAHVLVNGVLNKCLRGRAVDQHAGPHGSDNNHAQMKIIEGAKDDEAATNSRHVEEKNLR
jgi:hypothetical protein